MDRADILKCAGNDEERIFIAKILDHLKIAEEKYCVRFSAFLDLYHQSLADKVLKQTGCKSYQFSGGTDTAERKMLAIYHQDINEIFFPVQYIKVKSSMLSKLSHRDYLGTLMSLGIKRELIGDILTGENESFILVVSDIADYIINTVEKIGGVGVKLTICSEKDLPDKENSFEEKTDSVSSLRLDGIVSAFSNISRTKAKELIESSLVFVDGREITKCDFSLGCGMSVTIRGKGKYILDEANPTKKKDRLRIHYRKYK